MKLRIATVFLLCVLLLCSCSENVNEKQTDETVAENNISEENGVETKEEVKEDVNEDVNEDFKKTVKHETPEILSVKKTCKTITELHPDCSEILARCEYSGIYLDEAEKENYPLLYEALTQLSNMVFRNTETELDNMYIEAYEAFESNDSYGFSTYEKTLNHTVRRADSIVFSVVEDTYRAAMYAEPYRYFYGMNFDSATGELIPFSDVVKDTDKLIEAINEKLHSGMWTGELYSETAVKDYFDSIPLEDVSFTIEYYGVTVYFNHGEICDYVYGVIPVTLSFDEHSDLFDERYTAVPDSYITTLPMGISNYIDINGDGKQDEVIIAEYPDFEDYSLRELNIVTSAGNYYAEDHYAYGFSPYFIKTDDDRYLLYVFSHGADDFNRLMHLNVYDITGGNILKLGEMPTAPHHDSLEDGADVFSLPLNPQKMYFDFFNDGADFMYPVFSDEFEISSYGLPKKLGEDEQIPKAPEFNVENFGEYVYTSDEISGSVWYGYRFVDAESGMPTDCSREIINDDFVKLEFFNDGRGQIKLFGRYCDFVWTSDTDTTAVINLSNGVSYYLNLYRDTSNENGALWMFMQINEDILWLYKG